VPDKEPKYNFYFEWDKIAVLTISSYEDWWKKQLNDKSRNMIRKALKKRVEVKVVAFTDDFVKGIKEIYDETPIRQGKPFSHYREDFETLKRSHISFLERSDFIGAFFNNELIGFAKLVHGDGVSSLMQIISKISHRDKAPTNALISKAVEICEQNSVNYLHYGIWSRRGLGEFKRHHAFKPFEVPRYFVPLNLMGNIILKLGIHKGILQQLPKKWKDIFIDQRNKWYSIWQGKQNV
jgi:hypothetical protein